MFITIKLNADGEYNMGNNIITVATDTANSEKEWTSGDLSVLAGISPNIGKVYKNNEEQDDINVTVKDSYTLQEVIIGENVYVIDSSGMFTVNDGDNEIIVIKQDGNNIVLNGKYLASAYDHGNHIVTFKFNDNGIVKEAHLLLTVSEIISIKWEIDGTTTEETYEYMEVPTAPEAVKAKDAQYSYEFVGWDINGDGKVDDVSRATENLLCVAVFAPKLNQYKVSWQVGGSVTTDELPYGSIPEYQGTPVKESTEQYDYIFAGWDKEIESVTGDVTYVAQFTETLRKYTVTIMLDKALGGEVYTKIQVEYGAMPELPVPVIEPTAQYTYTFAGWSHEESPVYSDQEYIAKFTSTLRQYTVTWVVDGVETAVLYDYGTAPKYDGTPTKLGDAQYSYSFTGWDKEIAPVSEDVTYTAQFAQSINRYTVSFDVNGEIYTFEYEYGATPAYNGTTDKPSDGTYRYVFTGWNKEIAPVSESVTYVAQYDAVLIGKATVTNTSFNTAWNCEFTTTISLSDIENMGETVITVYYNPWFVALKSYECYEGVTVTVSNSGYITVHITGLSECDSKDIVDLVFVTTDYAPVGDSAFIEVECEDNITSNFGALTIYEMGDVNMDGRVNTVDAAMVQRYAVKKLELSDVQKAYGNVNGDYNTDGSAKLNTVDAAMIQRYAVKKLDKLGNRINVTFVSGDQSSCVSIVIGEDITEYFKPADGYAWSLSEQELIDVDFTALTVDTTVYLVAQQ